MPWHMTPELEVAGLSPRNALPTRCPPPPPPPSNPAWPQGRLWHLRGPSNQVFLVMNITDVDDKIIQRTVETLQEAGKPLDDIDTTPLTREMEALFWRDMRALNIRSPNVITRVCHRMRGSVHHPRREGFEWPYAIAGGTPPLPADQRDHRGKQRNLLLGKSDGAIFGPQTFGSQTPPPPANDTSF